MLINCKFFSITHIIFVFVHVVQQHINDTAMNSNNNTNILQNGSRKQNKTAVIEKPVVKKVTITLSMAVLATVASLM